MAAKKIKFLNEFSATLPTRKLPTNREIIKAIYFESENLNISKENAAKVVAKQVCELWKYTNIPCATNRRVKDKVEKYLQSYNQLLKIDSTRAESVKTIQRLQSFSLKLISLHSSSSLSF